MRKQLCRLVAGIVAVCAWPVWATTFTVPSLTGAAIQSTINTAFAAGSNNTVFFPAGLYNISSSITVPCTNGLTLTGPATTPATAVLNATFGGNDIFTMSNCTGVAFLYLGFRNTGALYFSNSNHSNIDIEHNQFGNLPSSIGGQSNASAAVYFDGSINSTDQNITILHNVFGDANSCTAVFSTTTDMGGYCAGIYLSPGILVNATIEYNEFYHVEEGLHLHQIGAYSVGGISSVANNVAIRYNYFHAWHRIASETQVGITGTQPFYVADNFFANPINPSYGTMFISNACCQFGRTFSTSISQPSHPDDNVMYTDAPQTVGSFHAPVIGIEYWAAQGSTANNNVMGGNWSNFVDWGFEGSGSQSWYIQNNYLCGAYNGLYIGNEEGQTNKPIGWDGAGNTLSSTCAQQPSTAPSISPPSGSYTSPPTITLSNAGTNTSTYFTTDGSTPVPGSGTTQLYTGAFGITLPATIKAVGMWGVAPQPMVHEAPYGYKPSAVQSASYTATGGVTLASVALSNVGSVHTLVAGTSIQMTATCTYSDGSTTNCNGADAHGNSVSSWNSSNAAVTISSGGLAVGASVGSANVTATVAGQTTPAWAMAVTAASVSLNSIALATTGGVSSIAVGALNQLIATCTYSDSSTTNCASTDSHGNVVNPWTSTAPGVATISTSGVVTGQAAGSTNLGAQVTAGMVSSRWGQTAYDTAGFTTAGFINSTYFVLGSQPGGYTGTGGSCSFYLPSGSLTVGSLFDCGLIPAPTPTTQANAWLCWGTYTVGSSTAPGSFVTVPMNSCGATIAAGTAFWVAVATNAPGHPAVGFDDCGSGCSGAAPTVGNGTYPYRYIAAPYGTRSGMGTAMVASGTSIQVSQYVTLGQPSLLSNTIPLTVTAATPTLVSAYLSTPGNVTTMTVGGTLQFSARCVYSDTSTTDCSVADIHGNAVTSWITSDTTKVTIGAVGTLLPGLAAAQAAGTPYIQAFIGSLASARTTLTITSPAVTLTGISLATTGGVTGLFVGSTNALVATCIYSDGSSANCTSTDSHGTVAGGYTSSTPAHATVNAATGLVSGVAPGSTTLSASAGGFTSVGLPLMVLAVPSGTYNITITGPVSFSGKVQF